MGCYSRRRRDKVIPSGITLRAEELRKVQYLAACLPAGRQALLRNYSILREYLGVLLRGTFISST